MRAVIFDLDGTLVDSAQQIAETLAAAWATVLPGHRFPLEKLRIGAPLTATLPVLDPSLDADTRASIIRDFAARYDASDFGRTRPYPGIEDVVTTLSSQGVRCAIATNKRRTPALGVAKRWFPEKFTRIACTDGSWPTDDAPREKAGMLSWILAAEGIERERAVMVGDTVPDITAARAAGIRAIAVAWGYEETGALIATKPDVLVRTAAELLDALRETV